MKVLDTWLTINANHSPFSVSTKFKDPNGYQRLQMLKSLIGNDIVFAHDLHSSSDIL